MNSWELVLIGSVFVGMLVIFVGGMYVSMRAPKNGDE